MASESGENVASPASDVRWAAGERTPLLQLRTHTLIDQMEYRTELLPAENIYSFHMFMVPVETRRTGKHGMAVCFAYFMVVINLLMQFWLLTMVSNFVVLKNKDLSDSLVRKDALPWYRAHEWVHQHWLKQEEPPSEACHDGSALCFQDGAYITCAPPSIQVLKHWYLLDTNEDDLWSRSEAHDEDFRKVMQCKHNVDVSILFDEMLNDIQDTVALKGRLHTHITNGTAIPKAYFDWFIGEPMLCQYGDQDMCGNLFERGIFDGALRPENQHAGGSERGIHDVQTARDYCTNLLTYRCDGLLPSTYRVWKVSSVDKCGDKDFVPVFYNPPGDLAGQWMLRVSFSQQSAYAKAGTWEFTFYLASLLFVFFAVMYEECKSIYQVYQWWWLKPMIDCHSVRTSHIVSVFSINLIRTILFVVLLYSGIVFMQEDTDVLHLIFDALSLVFIIGIDEILYAAMVRKQMKDEHKAMAPVTLPRKPFVSITVVTIECIRVGLLAICSLAICYLHMEQTMKPISKALRCLCTVEGEQCYEVATFDASWWENYWAVTLPQAAADIDDLMAL